MSRSATGSVTEETIAPQFVEVALPLPLRRTFTYRLPVGLAGKTAVGARVVVPFGKRHLTGYSVVLHEELSPELELDESAVKEIIELLDAEPLPTVEIIKLTRWVADYYLCSWGEVLRASLPGGINAAIELVYLITETGRDELAKVDSSRSAKVRILRFLNEHGETAKRGFAKEFIAGPTARALRELVSDNLVKAYHRTFTALAKPKRRKAVRLLRPAEQDQDRLTEIQEKIVETLRLYGGEMLFADLLETADVGASPINTLAKRGLLEVLIREVRRDPLGGRRLPENPNLVLTEDQDLVLAQIVDALSAGDYKAFLLEGVTGSGKTEIYIRAMKSALENGQSALMLVPEIALTPVFSKRLRSVFGDDVAILHSGLSTGERFDEWRRIRRGDARVAIGTRSAVFAPLRDIGLIIVDEEHDTSYRQNEMPFYHGRDTAVVRAKFAGAVVVLGSATPSIETFYNSMIGKYQHLHLPNRIGNRPLAAAELIDMREVFKSEGKNAVLAPQLLDAIESAHSRGEQSIILLNRRGFSSFVLCRSCGETVRCPNCDITLTYHRRAAKLICHYCDHRTNKPDQCPACRSEFLFFLGEGTEQIEGVLRSKFPELRIARVDRDTTKRKNELEETLSSFSRGEIDMLVGTQMLAKGHDFHNVTLVGVVSVDTGLGLPDFRAAERTFQLLTQVAGRAGRGNLPGNVLIQTFYPEHYALRHAVTQSYQDFFQVEVNFRRKLNYPPFVAMASILIKHQDYRYAADNARILRTALNKVNRGNVCIVLGPALAALARLKGEHRLQILIKSENRSVLRQTVDSALAEAEAASCDMRIVFVEIDPVNLM